MSEFEFCESSVTVVFWNCVIYNLNYDSQSWGEAWTSYWKVCGVQYSTMQKSPREHQLCYLYSQEQLQPYLGDASLNELALLSSEVCWFSHNSVIIKTAFGIGVSISIQCWVVPCVPTPGSLVFKYFWCTLFQSAHRCVICDYWGHWN